MALNQDANSHEEERARLDALLKNRPEAKELQDKNILPSGNLAPALQAKQLALEKAQREDALAHSLNQRPDRKELEAQGILRDGKVAPALLARQEELRRAQLEDGLKNAVQNRPDRDELEKRGILQPAEGEQ